MLKRSIIYTNPFTEKEVTEEHWFHISKADLVKMEMEEHGATYTPKDGGDELTGMQAKLQQIIDSEDGKAIMREFEDIIRRAYGKREGDRFLKSQEIWDDFRASEAYSQLFWELCTQPDAAGEFISGVVPANLDEIAEDVRKQAELRAKGIEAQATAKAAGTPAQEEPATQPTQDSLAEKLEKATAENPAKLTPAEMGEIDSDELKSGLATGRIKLQ